MKDLKDQMDLMLNFGEEWKEIPELQFYTNIFSKAVHPKVKNVLLLRGSQLLLTIGAFLLMKT